MNQKLLILLFVFIGFMTSCSQDDADITSLEESSEPQVYIAEGMFVFQSDEHLSLEMNKLNSLSFSEKEEWFEKFGVNTYGRVFAKVILAEDSISNYFESLPLTEQEYFKSEPQVYSDVYKDAFNQGIIHLVTEPDDNSYFDVNLYDKTYADFVNLDGKIKIGSNVYQISECETKIYTDVKDEDITCLEDLKYLSINKDLKMNLKSSDVYNWSEIKQAKTYDKKWGHKRKKVWAEILGESYMNIGFEDESSTCCRSVYSNFVLKGFAQKRNFWGNFVFSGDFWPLIEKKGSWEFEYSYWNHDSDPSDNCLCGYYSSDKTDGQNYFPSFYCTPGHVSYCPTPPIDISVYGNGYHTSVSPTGLYSYTSQNGLWWAQPFSVYNLDITITVDGRDFKFTN